MDKVTIKDVAKAAGVSYATVSRAFSGSSEIGEETKKRILKISEAMGYMPNSVARSMVKKRTDTFGLVVPSIQNPYMSEFTSCLEQRARKSGYSVMVCNSYYDSENERSVLKLLLGKQVDGLFLMPIGSEPYDAGIPLSQYVPTVYIGENLIDLSQPYVSVDNYAGAKMGTEYLYSLGHRHILYLGARKNSVTHEKRLQGYMDACAELGIPADCLNSGFRRSSQQSGYMLAKHFFEKPLQHTAIFCSADSLAIGVMQAADEIGLRIPEDVSLMGFDNISFTSLPRISLTTIDQSIDAMAEAALSLMLAEISGKPDALRHRTLKPSIVERTSCKMVDCK